MKKSLKDDAYLVYLYRIKISGTNNAFEKSLAYKIVISFNIVIIEMELGG